MLIHRRNRSLKWIKRLSSPEHSLSPKNSSPRQSFEIKEELEAPGTALQKILLDAHLRQLRTNFHDLIHKDLVQSISDEKEEEALFRIEAICIELQLRVEKMIQEVEDLLVESKAWNLDGDSISTSAEPKVCQESLPLIQAMEIAQNLLKLHPLTFHRALKTVFEADQKVNDILASFRFGHSTNEPPPATIQPALVMQFCSRLSHLLAPLHSLLGSVVDGIAVMGKSSLCQVSFQMFSSASRLQLPLSYLLESFFQLQYDIWKDRPLFSPLKDAVMLPVSTRRAKRSGQEMKKRGSSAGLSPSPKKFSFGHQLSKMTHLIKCRMCEHEIPQCLFIHHSDLCYALGLSFEVLRSSNNNISRLCRLLRKEDLSLWKKR